MQQIGSILHYGKLSSAAKRDLLAGLERYSNQFVRISIEVFTEDKSKTVRVSIPVNTRNRLKRARIDFNRMQDRPLSMEQYINYLLDKEENQ